MKNLRIILAACAALASTLAFGLSDDAAVANRKWVRKAINDALGLRTLVYEATTNADGTVTYSSKFTCEEDASITSCYFTVSMNTNPAVCLKAGTIPGLTNRVLFVENGSGLGVFVNASNSVFSSVSVVSGYEYDVTTNRYEWNTNFYRVVSNRVYRSRFTATASDGTQYASVSEDGLYYLQANTNSLWRARIIKTACSDEERSAIIGTPLAATGRRFSLFDLFFGTAYAAGTSGGSTQTISDDGSISWSFTISGFTVVRNGMEFTIADSLTFEYGGTATLPAKPGDEHTHDPDPNNDCVCKSYETKLSDAEESEDYKYEANKSVYSGNLQFSDWCDSDTWTEAGGKISTVKGKEVWKITLTTQNGGTASVQASDIYKSDSFQGQLKSYDAAIDSYLVACQLNYKKQQVCEDSSSHHDEGTCGSTTICKANKDHLGPHEFPDTWTSNGSSGHYRQCTCKAKYESEGHSLSGSSDKVYKRDSESYIIGWTINAQSCTKCPFSKPKVDHDCVHIYCHSCEGGNDCTLACPRCNGSHSFSDPTESSCGTCQCPDCGVTKVCTVKGGSPVQETTKHGGWYACTNPNHQQTSENDGNERGKGRHCCCDCGYNTCKSNAGSWDDTYKIYTGDRCAESTHTRTTLADPTYAKIENDETYHWKQDKSDCTRCGDPYGVKEDHNWGDEDTPHYKYLSNEKCAMRKKCEDCDYLRYQDEDTAGSHSEDTTVAATYSCSSSEDDVCKKTMTCSKCRKSFYTEETHVVSRTAENKCKCGNCKTYQFDHEYNQTDACGNKKCACGEFEKAEAEQTHKDYALKDGVHKCACGSKSHSPNWGDWYEVSRANGKINWKRDCKSCSLSETKQTDGDESPYECTKDKHIALTDACGCLCGYYTPGATVTLTNSDREIGQAYEGDDFHHWADTPKVNDLKPCTCDCTSRHKFREWSTYLKNQRTTSASTFCPVCAYCKSKDRSGNVVSEDRHVPKDKVVDGTKCGCKCGLLDTSATLAKFHPRYRSSCRCYGQNGDGTGAWHYRFTRSGCPNICGYSTSKDNQHLVSSSTNPDVPAKEGNVTATETDHTLSSSCGCVCGLYSAADADSLHNPKSDTCGCVCGKHSSPHKYYMADLNQNKCGCVCGANKLPHYHPSDYCGCECSPRTDPHVYPSSGNRRCYCYCGEKHNRNKGNTDVNCPGVCHICGESTSTDYGDLIKHTPSASGCGCECSDQPLSSYNDLKLYAKFHENQHATQPCWCADHCFHRWPTASPLCVNVCTQCFYSVDGTKNARTESSVHTFDESDAFCGCKCGMIVEGYHRRTETNCYCYAKNSLSNSHTRVEMKHKWKLMSQELQDGSAECPKCGVVSGYYKLLYECGRCGKQEECYVYDGCNCQDETDTMLCHCDTCDCVQCKQGSGVCDTCGKYCHTGCLPSSKKKSDDDEDEGSADGSTGGSDDPRNIL